MIVDGNEESKRGYWERLSIHNHKRTCDAFDFYPELFRFNTDPLITYLGLRPQRLQSVDTVLRQAVSSSHQDFVRRRGELVFSCGQVDTVKVLFDDMFLVLELCHLRRMVEVADIVVTRDGCSRTLDEISSLDGIIDQTALQRLMEQIGVDTLTCTPICKGARLGEPADIAKSQLRSLDVVVPFDISKAVQTLDRFMRYAANIIMENYGKKVS